jgi:hypothetical protein
MSRGDDARTPEDRLRALRREIDEVLDHQRRERQKRIDTYLLQRMLSRRGRRSGSPIR